MRTVAFLLMLNVMGALAAETNAPATEPMQPARPVPNFTLKNLDGLEVNSTNYAGTTRLVWFWASWDKPCQKQLPDLVEIQRDLESAGVRVLGLVLDAKEPATLKQFATENSINFPVLVADYGVIQEFGGIEAIPTLYVIEPHGVIIQRFVGYINKDTLKKLVQAVLDNRR